MANLTEDEVSTLSMAAVLGPRFDAGLLPTITGQPTDHILSTLRKGVAAQLLIADASDPRAFAFRHALTSDALLAQLLPFERVEAGRRVLAAIETHHPELPGGLCELAAMLAEQVGDSEHAAELLLQAARRAFARGALSSAEPTLDRAWRLARREGTVWPEVGDDLMAVLIERGDVDRALEVGDRLLAELPASSARAGIHLAMARAAAAAARWSTAVGAIERARVAADVGDPAVHALADAIAADIAAGEHRYDEAEALASGALVIATREEDHELECQALLVIGRCARIRGDGEAEKAFDRVIEIGRDHGLATWRLRGVMERTSLDLWAFLPDAQIASAREEAAGAGALVVAAHPDNFLAWSALDHHDPDRADVAIARCVALTRKLRLVALEGWALGAAALAAAQRGDRRHMELRTAESIAVSGGHADVAMLGPTARAAYWARHDDLARMATELEATMDRLRLVPHLPTPARGLWALVRAIEDRDAAAALAELEANPAVNHAICKAYWHYATAVMLGRAGDGAAADHHMALGDGSGVPLAWFQHQARRLVAEAALADEWGDPVGWLREALTEFERRGEDDLVVSCRRLLSRAGVPVPRRSATAHGVPADLAARGITARELEVLELLGAATGTKDIASQLFLSPKTVERHISNLATKLDVAGRSGAVAFAAARFAARTA